MIKNLFYKQGDFQLKTSEWSFSDKKIVALTGISGSGKSTVLKILCGLIPCPDLVWNFQKQNLALLPPPKRGIGMCFQDLRLFPLMSARQNILFALQAQGLSFQDKNKSFEEIVEFLDIKNCLDLFIDDLSGGEKQRVALARALITRPQILFLDEPFSYLDQKNKDRARGLTSQIVKKYSLSLLLVSHDQEDLKNLADEEFCLKGGQIYKKT